MQPTEFLAAVLPTEGQGRYCVFALPSKRNEFYDTIDALNNAAQLSSIAGNNAFFGLAVFHDRNRLAANALAVRAIWVDIDCGNGKSYLNKRAAVEALAKFLQTTGLDKLGNPWTLDSGGGVHVYWPLDDDVCIEDWKPVAENLKRTAQRLGFLIDMTVTADAARVLRVPGTMNYKYDPPREVVLRSQGDVFNIHAINAKLDKVSTPVANGSTALALPSMRPAGLPAPMSPVMQAMTQNRVTTFKNIIVKTVAGKGCGQIKHYFEHAADDGMEPLWRGLLSIAKSCEDAAAAAVKLTNAHPYPHDRMHMKLSEIKGPYPCTKLDSENPGICGNCPHWGKITNPLALGWENAVENVEKTYAIPTEDPTEAPRMGPRRALAPRGFTYGQQGGVYRTVSETDSQGNVITSEVMVTPYDFFMVDLLCENDSYKSRFAAVRAKTITYIVLPSASLASKDSTIKELSRQNIMSAFGSGNDAHLYSYVRACVENASAGDSALQIPPRYGWQADQSFAVCDQVLQQNNTGYEFPSDSLRNLIQITQTRGTLGDWQRYVQLIKDKGLWDILAFMGVGFGSPLMEFAGAGTPAMMFHACSSETGRGKTLALHMAASVWGPPTKYLVTPSTSERTMMQRAGMLGSLPLIVDEVTAAQRASKGEFIPSLVFDYSQGAHKIKGSGSANAELINDLFWRALGIISSNEPAMEKMLTARNTTSHGELMRILEWHATTPLAWTEAERELKDVLEHNYGHAGRIYSRWLVENRAIAQAVTVRCIERVRVMLNAPDEERFWVGGIGTCMAGLILAGPKYSNVIPFDLNTKELFRCSYKVWVDNARALISSNARSSQDLLDAYVRENNGNFVRIDPAKGPTAIFDDGRGVSKSSTRGRVAGRVEYGVRPGYTDFFIETATFKQYCAERNRPFATVVRELGEDEAMVVQETKKDLLAKTGGPRMYVKCLHISTVIQEQP